MTKNPPKSKDPKAWCFGFSKTSENQRPGLCSMTRKHGSLKKACWNAGLRGVAPPKSKDQTSELGSLKQADMLLIYIDISKDPKTPLKGDGALPSKGSTAPTRSIKREAHTMGENNTQPPNRTQPLHSHQQRNHRTTPPESFTLGRPRHHHAGTIVKSYWERILL